MQFINECIKWIKIHKNIFWFSYIKVAVLWVRKRLKYFSNTWMSENKSNLKKNKYQKLYIQFPLHFFIFSPSFIMNSQFSGILKISNFKQTLMMIFINKCWRRINTAMFLCRVQSRSRLTNSLQEAFSERHHNWKEKLSISTFLIDNTFQIYTQDKLFETIYLIETSVLKPTLSAFRFEKSDENIVWVRVKPNSLHMNFLKDLHKN